uniref:tRNA (guanine-N(7)-)-methyltransferase n=1 Tax=Aceria tosichella TaxID=561515 RepID=A0A6G1SJC4_9ACAR
MSDLDDANNSDNEHVVDLPRKRFFRQRAHVNPIADHNFKYPLTPDETNWSEFYQCPEVAGEKEKPTIRYLDVGCGFGGLLISLAAELPPGSLALGMEIRTKVSDYVQKRILALRSQNPGQYGNVWCIRTNAMRYLPNYIHKGQLHKMFFLFPDPHFKKTKHKWRIINDALLAEYAYVCAIDAIVYIATDVSDLFDWMLDHFQRHPLFEQISESELANDKIAELITTSTEESKKVARNEGDKFRAAFRRVVKK